MAKPNDPPTPPALPTELPVKSTPTNWVDVAEAIERVWDRNLMGGPLTPNATAVLLAQWHIETGEGSATSNFNLAGMKCTKPATQQHQFFKTKESNDGGLTLLTVGGRQPANCFRAFATLDDGVRGWLETIAGGYRETLPFLLAGNGAGWARAIGPTARGKNRSWYTGPETNDKGGGYVQVAGALSFRYLNKLKTQLPPPRILVESVTR
jgi:hypothetical protein